MLTGEDKSIATQYLATPFTWVEVRSRGAQGSNTLSCSPAWKLNMLRKHMWKKKRYGCTASLVKYEVHAENQCPSIAIIKVQSPCQRTINSMRRPNTLTSTIILFVKQLRMENFKLNTSWWTTMSLTFLQSWRKWSSVTSSSYSDCGEQCVIASGSLRDFLDCTR